MRHRAERRRYALRFAELAPEDADGRALRRVQIAPGRGVPPPRWLPTQQRNPRVGAAPQSSLAALRRPLRRESVASRRSPAGLEWLGRPCFHHLASVSASWGADEK